VRFPDGAIRPLAIDHWVEQIVGRPVGGGPPMWSTEPDWFQALPDFNVRRVMEKEFDYIALAR
jgi:hypothetical protein